MKIIKLVQGLYATNCYILIKDNNCIIVDPNGNAKKIIEAVQDLKVLAIVLTHGHFDHIGAVDKLAEEYNCKVFMNSNDSELVNNPRLNSINGVKSLMFTKTEDILEPSLTIGEFNFEVYYTPGHTEGSTIFIIDNYLIAGDTLFKGSIGRSDFPYSSESKMRSSIKLIKTLEPNLIVLSGHGEESTLKYELENNYYLR
jgi:glyoxylase-like metal-dependent hydrolase (beta-lactamase superfamily II)